jgi:hypothetical protein
MQDFSSISIVDEDIASIAGTTDVYGGGITFHTQDGLSTGVEHEDLPAASDELNHSLPGAIANYDTVWVDQDSLIPCIGAHTDDSRLPVVTDLDLGDITIQSDRRKGGTWRASLNFNQSVEAWHFHSS